MRATVNDFFKSLNMFYVFLGLVYTSAHFGLFFISDAIYWDDWVLNGFTSDDLKHMVEQGGGFLSFGYYVHSAIRFFGVYLYKYTTFILFFFSGILLDKIISRENLIDDLQRCCVVLLFLTLPFNVARVAQIDFVYTLCYFLFFLGWFFIETRKILSFFLFILSFNTNSLLVFFAVPFIFYCFSRCVLHNSSFIDFIKRNWLFAVAPFFYYALKLIFFRPYGIYAGYNESFSFGNIVSASDAQAENAYALFDLLVSSGFNYLYWILVFILAGILALIAAKFFSDCTLRSTPDASPVLCIFGVICVFFALVPYWLLGYVPTFFDWESRHQLLMPLGFSLFLVGFFSFFRVDLLILYLTCLVVVGSIFFWNFNYVNLYVDWKKQQQLIRFFSKIPAEERNVLYVINDHTNDLNGIYRTYRNYEWNGIINFYSNQQSSFAIPLGSLEKYLHGDFDNEFVSFYNAKGHVRDFNLICRQVNIEKSSELNSMRRYLFTYDPALKIYYSDCVR